MTAASEIDIGALTQANVNEPFVAVLYGPGGVGKTTLACHAPTPFVLSFEHGLKSERLKHIPKVNVATFAVMVQWLRDLIDKKHPFQTIVYDGLDAQEDLVTTAMCTANGWLTDAGRPDISKPGYGKGEVELRNWYAALDVLERRLNDRGISIVKVGHQRSIKVSPPTSEPYSTYGFNLRPQIAELLYNRADLVGFMSTPITLVRDDNARAKIARAISSDRPALYLRGEAAFFAKNRYDMPALIQCTDNPAADAATLGKYIPWWAERLAQAAAKAA